MTQEQETALRNFEADVRRLIKAYLAVRDERDSLARRLDESRAQTAEAAARAQEWQKRHDTLRTARLLEVSGDDIKAARTRISKLIRDIDKSIALLDV